MTLVHVSVHGRHGKVAGGKLVREPIDLSPCVAEDDCLGDGDSLVEIGEGVELPVFFLDGNIKLLDTFKRELSLLNQDADRVTHELCRDLEDVLGHGGRQEDDLGGLREKLEYVVDLLREAALLCSQQRGDNGIEGVGLTESISSASSRTNIFIESVLSTRRCIISCTRPGVPTTTCGPAWRAAISSRTLVPPIHAWQSIDMKSPMATTTFWICCASSRVGARMRAWQALTLGSSFCKTEMEKVAVFPVPDCA